MGVYKGGLGTWRVDRPATPESRSIPPTEYISHTKLKASAPGGKRASGKDDEAVRIVMGAVAVEPAVIAITSRSHDDVLEYTHAFVAAYCRQRFRGTLVDPLSLATYELLGNALNYGSVSGEVELRVIDKLDSIVVSVSNESMQVRIDMLCSHLERLRKDPESTFLDEMRRSTAKGGARPMLGLARIVHEAKLKVDAYVTHDHVTVQARSTT